MADLDLAIDGKIGEGVSNELCFHDLPDIPEVPVDLFDEFVPTTEPAEREESMPDADEYPSSEAYDQYLNVNVLLDRGGDSQLGVVKQRKRDANDHPVGRSNLNPLLDTREYEVEIGRAHV